MVTTGTYRFAVRSGQRDWVEIAMGLEPCQHPQAHPLIHSCQDCDHYTYVVSINFGFVCPAVD